ncbi:MAG: hypothetical protein MUE98_13765 [Rhodobacteraceae bacterium]|jgi:hypothetical protein|nr:hypothetical protein [Paracoccaceae bacterium]
MTNTLRPEALLRTARRLATPANRGRPLQSDLRRAVSTAYYAVFHALAAECADQTIGRLNRIKIKRAWAQAYRALDHGRVKAVCASSNSRVKGAYRRFPDAIRAFGDTFVALQTKRHAADYDPLSAPLSTTEVIAEIGTAERAILDFRAASVLDRRAFCVFVIHDLRP